MYAKIALYIHAKHVHIICMPKYIFAYQYHKFLFLFGVCTHFHKTGLQIVFTLVIQYDMRLSESRFALNHQYLNLYLHQPLSDQMVENSIPKLKKKVYLNAIFSQGNALSVS